VEGDESSRAILGEGGSVGEVGRGVGLGHDDVMRLRHFDYFQKISPEPKIILRKNGEKNDVVV